jgi:hypothetical protein
VDLEGAMAAGRLAKQLICVALFGWALWLAARDGHSFVGVFNRLLDSIFVGVLRKWREAWVTSTRALQ